MSTFSCPLVQITNLEKHPWADTLSITKINGIPVVIRTTEFSLNDFAIYIPVEAVVPLDRSCFEFLRKKPTDTNYRVKSVKLRGIYSEGLLIKPSDCFDHRSQLKIGEDYSKDLGIEKYIEPPTFFMSTDNESDPGFMPHYDMEAIWKYQHLLIPNETLVCTEKLHGCCSKFLWRDNRLWVGSHNTFKKYNSDNLWWKAVEKYKLEEKLQLLPGIAVYGEVYGHVQDLKYSVSKEEGFKFSAFDMYDTYLKKWIDHDELTRLLKLLEIPMVPLLGKIEFNENSIDNLAKLASGLSTIDNATMREGIVVRPTIERWNLETGRTIFKLVSPEYKLRKKGTEFK